MMRVISKMLLAFFYGFLYLLVKLALYVYYRIRVAGLDHGYLKGPLIILSNHPNTLMDPILIVTHLRRMVYFLANAGLFRTRLTNAILSTLYCIPIERPSDVDRPINNAENFAKSRHHLQDGGALFIAPEGTSIREYGLRPLKTGFARIALDLLSADQTDEIHILMCGIHYQDPTAFRSRVLLRFAPVLTLRRDEFHGDLNGRDHVRALTDQVEEIMKGLLPHGDDDMEAALLEVTPLLKPYLNHPDWVNRLYGLKKILDAETSGSEKIHPKLKTLLAEKNLKAVNPEWQQSGPPIFSRCLMFFLTIPFLIQHLFIFGGPELIRRSLKFHPAYDATVRFLGGLIIYFPGIYLLYKGWGYIGLSPSSSLLFLGITMISGPFAWQQWKKMQEIADYLKFKAALKDKIWKDAFVDLCAPFSVKR